MGDMVMNGEQSVNPLFIIFQRMCILKSKALTWAVIIGVLVTFIVPSLLLIYQEREKVIRLKSAYTIFSQAFSRATLDNSSPDTWDIGKGTDEESSLMLYDYFRPYLSRVKQCNGVNDCFSEDYSALFSTNFKYQPNNYSSKVKGVLGNGISFIFLSSGTGCSTTYSGNHFNQYCGSIIVDINGVHKPNKAGVDLFGFGITPTGIYPFGIDDTKKYGYMCQYKDFSNSNGLTCTNWVITKENMDYLRKKIKN